MSSIQTKADDKAMNQTETALQARVGSLQCPLCESSQVSEFLSAPDRFHRRHVLYQLMRCASCSCVWLKDPPKPEEMGPHYDEEYHKAITAAGEGSASIRWKRQRETISKHKSGGAILDIGCSSGGFLSTMQGPSWKLHGIEMEESTAERARKITGAEVFVGEALDAPFAPESFDVVTTFDVLEHVYQPPKFLAKISEWLKPGGIYYTMLPNIESWEARMLGSYWYGLELPRHLFHFSPQSLSKVMASLGFIDVSIKTMPTSYLERSAHYLNMAVLEKLGASPAWLKSLDSEKRPSIPERAVRKALRLSAVIPFGRMASAAGSGASMEAVFAKPAR